MNATGILNRTFRAPRPNQSTSGVDYHTYKEGTQVSGVIRPGVNCQIFQTSEGFSIPLSAVTIKESTAQANYGRYNPNQSNAAPAPNTASQEVPPVDPTLSHITKPDLVDKITGMAQVKSKGLIWGAVLGLGYAMATGRNKIIFSGLGALSGSFIASYLKKKNSKVNER